MKKLRVRVWGCLARNASASRRRSCHPERPGVIIITENREGLREMHFWSLSHLAFAHAYGHWPRICPWLFCGYA
jgi:hypothetical protein